MSASSGILFAIKRYAIHDGPNIRTTVFLKGCPLECWWCHNPEGLSSSIQLTSSPDLCINCGDCIDQCTHSALSKSGPEILRDEQLCEKCYSCVETCPALAHEMTGWRASVTEVMSEILKDKAFYDETGGGVTFSGGEPLMQPKFLIALLEACHASDIHCTVDTSAYSSPKILLAVAQHTDLFLIDLKHVNSATHKLHTGVENQQILNSIRMLAEQKVSMRIRIPILPGINNDLENLSLSAQFVADLPGQIPVDILPYHDTARSKYAKLGLDYPHASSEAPSLDQLEDVVSIFQSYGISTQIGG